MKKVTALLLVNLMITAAYCQMVSVQGTLKDSNGEALPGASVVIKGTTQGTVADLDGHYTLDAPVGSILVVTFVGYLPMEFEVTNTGQAKLVKKQNRPHQRNNSPQMSNQQGKYIQPNYTSMQLADTTGLNHDPENGVAVMNSNTTYKINKSNYSGDYANLKIKRLQKHGDKQLIVFKDMKVKRYYKPKIFLTSSLSLEQVNNLPSLQNRYAQGISAEGSSSWQGPESGSLFSWGPMISQLEFDGADYPYDKNGRLVPLFTGNGQKANAYKPYEFFKRGVQSRNAIRVEHRIGNVEYFTAFKGNYQTGVIPNSDFKRNTFDGGLKYKVSKIDLMAKYAFSKVNSEHAASNILGYHTMKSVLLSPPTFDNSNGYGQDAINTRDAYYTQNNEQRSAAVDYIDNPYWLLNNSTDQLNVSHHIYKLDFSYALFNNAKLNVIVNGNNQSKKQDAGVHAGSFIFADGTNLSRVNNLDLYGSQVSLNNIQYSVQNLEIAGFVKYHYTAEKASLESIYSTAYPSLLFDLDSTSYKFIRHIQKLNARVNLNYHDVLLFSTQAHRSFYSDIEDAKAYLGGVVSGGFILSNINGIRQHGHILSFCKIYGSYGNDYSVAPLISDATQYSSVGLSASELNNFFPTHELVAYNDMQPENVTTTNVGMDINFHHNRYALTVNWYNKETKNAILPDYSIDNEVGLANLAELRTQGIDFSVKTRHWSYRWIFFNELNFSKNKTHVTKLYNGLQSVPIAGFSFASANAIKGEPLGVLVGTKYQRDASGEIVIDEDGFPAVALQPGIFADPTPKWTASLLNQIAYKGFDFSVLWELKNGGEVWNGTKATLDYYGLSEESGDNRTVRNYVFRGNTVDGEVNRKAVDFANPNNSIDENRWVRYGEGGVAEAYVEDAGWFRIRSLNASYTFNTRHIRVLEELTIGVSLNNIILSKSYSGVDSESALFGQPGGSGLDYFNMPSTKSYGITVALKF